MDHFQKYSYIETFGCQMNDRDSEIISQLLSESYMPTLDISQADIVVVNTCSIREKAAQKAFSLLGRLKIIKADKPSFLICVVGCVAQQEGRNLVKRMPYIDLIVGPQQIYDLPDLIAEVSTRKKAIIAVGQSSSYQIPSFLPTMQDGPPHKRFVTIMQGCNNYCTYCVVPYTRGREVSRDHNDIIEEVNHLVQHGVKEITLLGQNVNSYGQNSKKGLTSTYSFAKLLRQVAQIKGIERLRFTTSNPKDLTEELTRCFAEIDILCPHFHLPVQSGSNTILKRMNRHYSIEQYWQQVNLLRKYRPDISITTDIIVGFPGESESDFLQTMDLVEKIRYHGAFSFKYSDRPQAKSVQFENKVEEEEKSRRLSILQKRLNEIILERNVEYVGKREVVMVEGKSKNSINQWSGRTGSNHIVNFSYDQELIQGQFVDILIEKACLHSLQGTVKT